MRFSPKTIGAASAVITVVIWTSFIVIARATADAAPMVLGEKRMGGIIRGRTAPRSGPVD